MIQELELWDFENHKHTLIDYFSDRFSAIIGLSNSGKSAIIRALKLLAYNDFDPRSVRLGCSNCKVRVKTEKGEVLVTRGKQNRWEVTPVGGTTEVFDKVGKAILPEAAEIIGMKVIQMGDADLKINLMEQLDKHFMLAEIEGQSASGSVRAQIFDEMSGLSGLETLIRDISLDNLRLNKEVKKCEEDNESLEKRLHNQDELEKESALIAKVESIVEEVSDIEVAVDSLKGYHTEFVSLCGKINIVTESFDALPETKSSEALIDGLEKDFQRLQGLSQVSVDHKKALSVSGSAELKLDKLPMLKPVESLVKKSESDLSKSSTAIELFKEYNNVCETIKRKNSDIDSCQLKIDGMFAEESELLDSIDICPLTLNPVSASCREEVENAKRIRQEGKH